MERLTSEFVIASNLVGVYKTYEEISYLETELNISIRDDGKVLLKYLYSTITIELRDKVLATLKEKFPLYWEKIWSVCIEESVLLNKLEN